ncbi:RadC family protein [Vagococcus zengguangii]|uniref:JAB domain-containing protein n=1 Tax=Vagococcus zengguangii TaxID=2571750 RepID=A0A4D7CSD1_9ENTE|nr:DNA repair protein RadC [Vagococcus zengguangii]QCI87089.1 JAB domain-containing protein [Vagococcus zengguangii]TLG80873.1 JAB domain-containing protein [Vagococcus zengguangii]
MLIAENELVSLPRERLLQVGVENLTTQELLAILLRTGTKHRSVIELSEEVVSHFRTLFDLKEASLEELQLITGVGKIKAIELQAAIELGQRVARSKQLKLGQVVSSHMLGKELIEEMKDWRQEHLLVIYLNTKNQMIKKEIIFKGTLNQSIAHPREIYRVAVKCAAARFILVHNHPSGNPEVSQQDIDFTNRIVECGKIMGIEILDHLVIGESSYVSMREEGIIE